MWSVVALVVAWVVVSGVLLLLGIRDASRGVSEIEQAEAHLSASDLVSQAPLAPLSAAHRDFSSSSSLLHFPLLTPFEVVPVLGRQLRSVRALASAATTVSRVGVSAVEEIRTVLDVPHPAGPARVATLEALAALATRTNSSLANIDLGPSQALLSPLATKRAVFVAKLDEVRTKLSHAAAAAGALGQILQGPRTYLVLMGNNAEMRDGSGSFLELGLLSAQDGQLHLSDVVLSPNLNLAVGQVPVSGDLEARWGRLLPGVDWRNLGLTPDFDVNAPLAARMWQAATGQHVDGVVAIDVEALHQLLEATGPVTLDTGGVIGADDVEQFLTHDQYEGLSDEGVNTAAAQARQDKLGSLAQGALRDLNDEPLDLRALADSMTAATSGRHILLWSADPSAESAWEAGGVGGTLTNDSLMVGVMNFGGNKLDQYLTVSARLRTSSHGASTRATLTVELQNHTPPGQSQYIAGPYPGLGTAYGEYVGALAVNLPADASRRSVAGNPVLDAAGAEGPTWLLAPPVDVKQGATEQVVVNFTLPGVHGKLTVVPSARIPPVAWAYPGGAGNDAAPFTVSW